VRRLLLLASLILLGLPGGALALGRANPADELAHIPIEASVYDPATHCSSKARGGVVELRRWLEENVRGVFWGSYGKHGGLRRHVSETVAHRDHIHIGMTKAGAAGTTSFWRGHTG
jgi:hypothetical protein